MNPAYLYLGAAIVAEVIATSALKASEEFTKFIPSILVIGGYGVAFFMLASVVKTIPIGVAYAIWAGLGVVLIAFVGAIVYKQIPDLAAVLGMAMIVGGVMVIHLFSKTVGH